MHPLIIDAQVDGSSGILQFEDENVDLDFLEQYLYEDDHATLSNPDLTAEEEEITPITPNKLQTTFLQVLSPGLVLTILRF